VRGDLSVPCHCGPSAHGSLAESTCHTSCCRHRKMRHGARRQKVVAVLLRMHGHRRSIPGPAYPHVAHSFGGDAKLHSQASRRLLRHGPELRQVDGHGFCPHQALSWDAGCMCAVIQGQVRERGDDVRALHALTVRGMLVVMNVNDDAQLLHRKIQQAAATRVSPLPASAQAHESHVRAPDSGFAPRAAARPTAPRGKIVGASCTVSGARQAFRSRNAPQDVFFSRCFSTCSAAVEGCLDCFHGNCDVSHLIFLRSDIVTRGGKMKVAILSKSVLY